MRGLGIRPRVCVTAGHRIDTDRLLLRSPAAADATEIARLLGAWTVAHWLVRVPFPYRTEHARAWIDRSAEDRSAGLGWPFMIMLRDENRLIGSMDLSLDPDRRSGALGYWIGQDYWGEGYATEAAVAMVQFAFNLLKLSQVTGSALPENERSMRVLEKAGLVHIDRRFEDTVERGRVDTEFFALDRADWP